MAFDDVLTEEVQRSYKCGVIEVKMMEDILVTEDDAHRGNKVEKHVDNCLGV